MKIVHVSKMNDLLDVALGLLGQKIVVSNERIVIGAYILQIENTRAWLYTKKTDGTLLLITRNLSMTAHKWFSSWFGTALLVE